MLALGYAAFACGVEGEITGTDGGPGGGADGFGSDASSSDGAAPGEDAGSVVATFGDASLVITPELVDLLAGAPAGGDAGRVRMELEKEPGDPATIESAVLTPAVDVTTSARPPNSSRTVFDFDLSAGANSTPQRVPISVVVRVAGAEKTLALTARVSRHYRAIGDTVIQNIAFSTTYDLLSWGAGGGTMGVQVGGAGGFTSATTPPTVGKLTIRVGGPGAIATGGMPGGGGGAGANGAGGGGFSGVFLGSDPPSRATFLVIAAGGGGAGSQGRGGNAGGFGIGLNGGQPGSALAGGSGGGTGASGDDFLGGAALTTTSGGGGGGGYNGGGAGGDTSGGGGGFSFAGNGAISPVYLNGTSGLPGNKDHPDRGTAGNPGAAGAVLVIAK